MARSPSTLRDASAEETRPGGRADDVLIKPVLFLIIRSLEWATGFWCNASMRYSRFRLRTLMIAVAVVATILALIVERHARFLRLAHYHGYQFWVVAEWCATHDQSRDERLIIEPDTNSIGTRCRALLQYHDRMRQKYWVAARYPWLPVLPDPPIPPPIK